MASFDVERRRLLQHRLSAVRGRIEVAARGADRDPATITLVVVTKTFPASDVRHLAALGVRDVGENRDQDGAPKAAECADLGLRWHFVGQLQTNKADSVVSYCDFVHSLDRPRLVQALDDACERRERKITCLIQVSLDDAPGRGGVSPHGVAALAETLERCPNLTLGGVMAVAPLGVDPTASFASLLGVARTLQQRYPSATIISAGMSGDLEAAVASGATHVRVGSAILGAREATH